MYLEYWTGGVGGVARERSIQYARSRRAYCYWKQGRLCCCCTGALYVMHACMCVCVCVCACVRVCVCTMFTCLTSNCARKRTHKSVGRKQVEQGSSIGRHSGRTRCQVRAPPPESLGTSCYPPSFIIYVLCLRLRPHLSEFLGASLFYWEHLGPEHLLDSFLQHEHKKGLTKTNFGVLAIALPVTLMSLDALERARRRERGGREEGREGGREDGREGEREREGESEGERENISGV